MRSFNLLSAVLCAAASSMVAAGFPMSGISGAPANPMGSGANTITNLTEAYIEEYVGTDGRLAPRAPPSPAWNYGTQKVRGVNIGGWLVAEFWIVPSLFSTAPARPGASNAQIIDEWTLGQYGSDALARLRKHWATFITADDFRQIKAAGLNHVRIPIGYWAYDTSAGEPYIRDQQASYLSKAVGWARSNGLKVMIDLHGVPGSQNGYDNSGRKGPIQWPNTYQNNIRAKNVLLQIARQFINDQDTVTAIELVNEPFMVGGQNIRDFSTQFYRDAIGALRYNVAPSNFALTIHDGFLGLDAWRGQFQPPQYQSVLLDTHIYTVFSPAEVAMTPQQRFQTICSKRQQLASSQPNLWTIVGEFSPAFTDCATGLNSRGVGARYNGNYPGSSYVGTCVDKTGNGSKISNATKTYLAQMFATQVSVYETGSGWFFWTWKAPNAVDWSYQWQLSQGIIPYNLDNVQGAQC